ncbi:MAG TPA: type II toxin-antitoxin system VapC family toxin [Caulobacteraceae bacterium]
MVDASVAMKFYFREAGSEVARDILNSRSGLVAPDLLFIEMASVAAKRVKIGLSTLVDAATAVSSIRNLIDAVIPAAELADRAFRLACEHGMSAYDGAYLALAERRSAVVITADARLIRRAYSVGLAHLVQVLTA